jgi:hypothetical protein
MDEKHQLEQQEKWERSTSTMKERKPFFETNTNTKTLNRREQVVISRLRTGYTRATHASVMNKDLSTDCLFCTVKITVDHILWHCKETNKTATRKGGKEGETATIREKNKSLQRNISNKVSTTGQNG